MLCNKEGKCWPHHDEDVRNAKRAGDLDWVGGQDPKTGFDSGTIYDEDGEKQGTYQQISHDDPVQRMLWGGANTIDTWKPVVEFIQPSPSPGGIVIGGVNKANKLGKAGKKAKQLWRAVTASRPLSAMGHAAKHLQQFRRFDPSLSEDDVAKILQFVADTAIGVPTANNATKHVKLVEIGDRMVKVKVIVSSSGGIKTGYPIN